jgi:apolipoprotein N-acyltransferase
VRPATGDGPVAGVEHARSTVVAAARGISAFVRPDGEVVVQSGLFEPALLQAFTAAVRC